jgi:hypothetical protein
LVYRRDHFKSQEKLQKKKRLTGEDCHHVLEVSNGSPEIIARRELHRQNLQSTEKTIHYIWIKRMLNVTAFMK